MYWVERLARIAASLAICAFFLSGTWILWHLPKYDLQPILQNVTQATGDWSKASRAQAQSVVAIERDARAELWHVDRTLTATDTAIGKVGTTVSTINDSARAVQPLLASATRATDQLAVDESSLNATILATKPLVDKTTSAVDHFDALLTSKDLADAMHHTAGMTESGDKMLADAQWKFHDLVHPTPKKGFRAAVGVTIDYLHKFEPPLF